LGRGGKDLVADYCCIANACAPSYVRNSTEGFAMKRLETNKYRKYQALYYRAGVDFVPLAMEMHGAITERHLLEVSEEISFRCC
jgi:hypothetical protein